MKCWECEKETEHIHEHHVVPRSRGGTKTLGICLDCHRKAHHAHENMWLPTLSKQARARKARSLKPPTKKRLAKTHRPVANKAGSIPKMFAGGTLLPLRKTNSKDLELFPLYDSKVIFRSKESKIPYGPKGRLLFLYMCLGRSAHRVYLGKNITSFVQIFAKPTGRNIKSFKAQLCRLFSLEISIDDGKTYVPMFTKEYDINDQGWNEIVELSKSFADILTKEASFPLSMTELLSISHNGRAIDVLLAGAGYFSSVGKNTSIVIETKELQRRFGYVGASDGGFNRQIKNCVKLIVDTNTNKEWDIVWQQGLVLKK